MSCSATAFGSLARTVNGFAVTLVNGSAYVAEDIKSAYAAALLG